VSVITTHVLDTAVGRPAVGVLVRLERVTEVGYSELGRAHTDHDGRATQLSHSPIELGTYRLVFDTAVYAASASHARIAGGDQHEAPFFPEVAVTFTVGDLTRDYHVPLLLSPFGYCTYRGS
jgi:5-hydroxyisourate hydrolase